MPTIKRRSAESADNTKSQVLRRKVSPARGTADSTRSQPVLGLKLAAQGRQGRRAKSRVTAPADLRDHPGELQCLKATGRPRRLFAPLKPLLAATLCLLLPSCAALRPATTPLSVIEHELTAEPSAGLIVLYPGYGDRPQRFERADFIEIIGEHAANFDVVALDAHFGYYRTATVVDRVYEDVLAPAIESGTEEIWLVGISMGGAGVISTANEHSDIIDGVIALAPYLGPPALIQEIADAGGLMAWDPGDVDSPPDDRASFFRQQWAWLQGYGEGAERPTLRLGVGDSDRLFEASSMVGAVLPEGAYEVREGGHNWRVWTPLFQHFVEMGI